MNAFFLHFLAKFRIGCLSRVTGSPRWVGAAFASGALVLIGLASGCAHYPINPPAHVDPKHGYRIANTPPGAGNSDEIFVILAFSGGGTRAAAFSFGVMEELRATRIGPPDRSRSLLSEVDIISSVSGGSFTAAYYGLFRERLFVDFEERFLHRNMTRALALGLINPANWFKLASSHYDRIDMAADIYDREVFDCKTFADLAAVGSRPFIVLNATDMTYASRFEFTQDQFDLLSSDVSAQSVARGVAASSAFPVLLSPMTIRNYPEAGRPLPQWIVDSTSNRALGPRDYANGRIAASYFQTDRRYIHLVDGGLSDNLGLRGPAQALFSVQNSWAKPDWQLADLVARNKIKHLVIITANAKSGTDPAWSRKENAPGVLAVLSTVAGGPMDNYTSETVQYVRDQFIAWEQAGEVARALAEKNGTAPTSLVVPKLYAIELSIADVADPVEREFLSNVATGFKLSPEAARRVKQAARTLLSESDEFKRMLSGLERESGP